MARIITEPLKARDTLIFSVPGSTDFRNTFSTPDQVGSYCLAVDGPFGSGSRTLSLPGQKLKLRSGFYWSPRTALAKGTFLQFRAASSVVCSFTHDGAGKINFLDTNGNIKAQSVNAVPADSWRHFQIKYDLSATVSGTGAGVCRFLIDNTEEFLFTGDTAFGRSYIDNWVLPETSGTSLWASLYINDDTGPAPENDLEGIVQMPMAVVIGDSAVALHNDWVRSTGTDGFTLVDEVPYSTADFVSSITNGQKQFFLIAPHGLVAPTQIRSITARWVPIKISGGRMEPSFRISGVDYPSTIRNLNVAPTILLDRRTTNPAGGNWTLAQNPEVGATTVIP